MAEIDYIMAARARLAYGGKQSIAGALLDKPDDDMVVSSLEKATELKTQDSSLSPIDVIEIMVANSVDGGEELPISNPEGFGAAQWLAQGDLASLPDPIPRKVVLYLAKAFCDAGKYPTMTDALMDILKTRTFVQGVTENG